MVREYDMLEYYRYLPVVVIPAITISLEQRSYLLSEGGLLTVQVEKFGDTSETVCVSINTEQGTAMGTRLTFININLTQILFLDLIDFIPFFDILCFLPTSTELRIEIAIVADDVPECAEIFLVQLTPLENNTVEVNLRQNIATISIMEDQGKLHTPLVSGQGFI